MKNPPKRRVSPERLAELSKEADQMQTRPTFEWADLDDRAKSVLIGIVLMVVGGVVTFTPGIFGAWAMILGTIISTIGSVVFLFGYRQRNR